MHGNYIREAILDVEKDKIFTYLVKSADAQYLKPLNTSEFGENQAVSFCFDFLPRPSKKHKKIPFL